MKKPLLLLLLAVFGIGPDHAQAQTPSAPYLTAATLYASVDYWGDIWINGIPVWGDLRYTRSRAWVNRADKKDSLCMFKRDNVLAISLADSQRDEDRGVDHIGFAYVLVLEFSNGTKATLTSDEAGEHSSYYSPEELPRTLVGWQRPRYQEGNWYKARGTGTALPNLAGVMDPRTRQGVQFLSASGSNLVRRQGEQHLFRRRFYLNISPVPGCQEPTPLPKPTPIPVFPTSGPEGFIPPPPPTSTPTLVPTKTLVPTRTATATRTYTHLPSMPAKYLPSPQPVVPTSTPRRVFRAPTATPTLRIISRETVESIIRRAPAATSPEVEEAPMWAAPIATPQPPAPIPDVTFEAGSANIYITFSDGPGRYKAQVEKDGEVLRVLFDEKVVGEKDLWLEWDGTNSQGGEVPTGFYKVVYSKDGEVLKTMTVKK